MKNEIMRRVIVFANDADGYDLSNRLYSSIRDYETENCRQIVDVTVSRVLYERIGNYISHNRCWHGDAYYGRRIYVDNGLYGVRAVLTTYENELSGDDTLYSSATNLILNDIYRELVKLNKNYEKR